MQEWRFTEERADAILQERSKRMPEVQPSEELATVPAPLAWILRGDCENEGHLKDWMVPPALADLVPCVPAPPSSCSRPLAG